MSMLPRDIDEHAQVEMQVLAAVMVLPEAFDKIGHVGLKAESFSHPALGAMWTAIERLAVACKPCDAVAVWQAMRAAGETDVPQVYVTDVAGMTWGARSVVAHAELVKRREIERAMAQAGAAITALAHDPGMSLADKLERGQELLANLNTAAVRRAPKHISELLVGRLDHLQEVADGVKSLGFPTHIPIIDQAMNGGPSPGQLIILAARPGQGKSSLAEQLGIGWASQGLPTLYLSQEMPEDEVADRGLSNTGRIDYGNLRTGHLEGGDWGRLTEAVEKLNLIPFYVDDQASLTLSELRTKARMVKGLKVLILDYLQLCSGNGDNRNAEIEVISRGLKTLAKEMGIVVIALSQLNRKVEERADKRPFLSDLRDSGAIEQDADVVIFLWPVREFDEYRIQGGHIAKNRHGRKPEFALHFVGSTQRWAESSADISPPAPPPAPAPRRRAFDPSAD